MENKKKSGTFVVHIKCCENATWQGDVTWAEENKKESFRSALELIRLIERFQDITRSTRRTDRNGKEVHIPCNMINCFCMYSDYTPLTLDEWIICDRERRKASGG